MTNYVLAEPPAERPLWDASHWQVEKYRTRYYVDLKPPCDLIPDPHDQPVPGFSSLKPPKPFKKSVTINGDKTVVPLDWYQAGEWIERERKTALAWDIERFYAGAGEARDRNFARGHAIHRVAEAFLTGRPTDTETNADALPYIPHLIAWLKANVTDIFAVEAVVFGNGYGGTGDGWLSVRGIPAYVDFKSRGADSSHGIYEEEIMQGGAYCSARYCILPSADRTAAVRANLPAVDHGVVLSIRPDGVEEHWYGMDAAKFAFAELHVAHLTGKDAEKHARAAKCNAPDAPATPKRTSKKNFPTPPAPPRPTPAEGPDVDVDALRVRYTALDAAAVTWIGNLYAEAETAGVGFHLKGKPTARRARIVDGLVTLAEAESDDTDVVRALVRLALGDDAAEWPTVPAGAAVGMLGATDAATFAAACTAFVGGGYHLEIRLDGPVAVAA